MPTSDEGTKYFRRNGGFHQGNPIAVLVSAPMVNHTLITAKAEAPSMLTGAFTPPYIDDCAFVGSWYFGGEIRRVARLG